VGTKLPPEREFAERLGVSRTVVREAVRILVTKGLLETRHGIGTSIRAVTREEVVKRLTLLLRTCDEPVSMEHLHQMRLMLEVENAGLAAEQATDADIADLRRLSAEAETATADPARFADRDAEFHRRLAETTHNPLLVALLDSLHDLYCTTGREPGNTAQGLIAEFRLAVAGEIGHYEQVMTSQVKSLKDVAESVAARDRNGARLAMSEHLAVALDVQRQLRSADFPLHSAGG
jgi:GntR family transcriptional repressor for pyruvate dehydrogenase complex